MSQGEQDAIVGLEFTIDDLRAENERLNKLLAEMADLLAQHRAGVISSQDERIITALMDPLVKAAQGIK
jgi:hypothetical protein